MNINKVFRSLIVILLTGLALFSSCKKDTVKSPSELYAEEMDLLERFKETATYDSLFNPETMLVIDSSETTGRYQGLVYAQLEKGTGDTVLLGKRVGIRYRMYYILDTVGAEEPFITLVSSNENAADPIVYMVGQPNPSAGIYTGIDLGVRFMNCYGKSRMLFPSIIGGNDYVTRIVEARITYMGR